MPTSRVQVVAMASLKRLFWTNLKMTESEEHRVAIMIIRVQFLILSMCWIILAT